MGFELREAQIEHLDNDCREKASECSYQAYLKWMMGKGVSSITVLEAIEIFHRAGEFEAIDSLISKLQRLDE